MDSINTVLNDICNTLEKQKSNKRRQALNGNAGLALFYFYYYKYTDKEIYFNKGADALYETIKKINSNELNNSDSTLFSGISGIGWLIEHLNELNFIDIDTDSLLSNSIDDYLHDRLLQFLHNRDYSYYEGALGHCFYFVKRYQNTKSNTLKLKYKNYILEQIFFLENQRIRGVHKSSSSYMRSDIEPFKQYLANIINFLSLLYYLNDFNLLLIPLLEDYTEILFNNTEKDNLFESEVALALWNSSNILENDSIKAKAQNIFQKNLFHKEPLSINDYFKTSMIYKSMFEKTNNNDYIEFKNYWQDKGIKNMRSNDLDSLECDLWDGLSGIGLSLLSNENNFAINWQECLLIHAKIK